MIQEFREFVFKGNVIDLAVAVVIGAALTSLVEDIITPLQGLLSIPDFST